MNFQALLDFLGLVGKGVTAGIPVFSTLWEAGAKIKVALQERGVEQDTAALEAAALEDDKIIAKAQVEKTASE
jgi:hypothetical protein